MEKFETSAGFEKSAKIGLSFGWYVADWKISTSSDALCTVWILRTWN